MTPAICVAAISFAQCPIVVTHHAHGDLGWMRPAMRCWGFLMDRVDARVAVSPMAAESAARYLPGDYRVIPNGVLIPAEADPADRDNTIVFIGRHDQRKGLPTLLRAWPRDPCRHRRPPAGDRHRSIAIPPVERAAARRRDRHRRPRDRAQRGADARARAGEAVGHPCARRRELRAGARRGLRLCDAVGRLRHPRLRGRRHTRCRAPRPSERLRRLWRTR